MAVDTRPPSYTAPAPRGLDRLSDEQLIARFRAGDDAALDVALRRHERRLLRFARRILGTRSPNAEDVVQEAMLRTHLVLRRGDRAIDLGPWLFKLVRNCALDELARVRSEVGPLDAVPEPAAVGSDPADVTAARGRMRDTLADVAALPDLQRHALLRREIEGATHADVAGELGITEPASRLLVLRARANLVKARAGRDARCDDIRDELLLADDAGRRASAHAYRHLATCAACREFRSALRQRRHDLKVLTPLPLLFGGLVGLKLAGGALLPGAGAGGSSVGAKLATAGAVTAA
ncbi:MAG TPA: sigma-70 family RNA polymerase sigma factor, partial [Solirubrobacteraceae bacterium]|nr:sigma-70 family RNA polymerase sigma factor [Solirubrobacteraceae bacterium]